MYDKRIHIFTEKDFLEKAKKRCAQLDFKTFSAYIRSLIEKDLKTVRNENKQD